MMVMDQQINEIRKALSIRELTDEDLLAMFYLQAKDDGTLQVFFHEIPNISLNVFLKWAERTAVTIMGCFLHDLDTGEKPLAGIGVINQIKQVGTTKVAEIGVAFLRKHQDPRVTREFCEMLLDFCFLDAGLTAVIGSSPVPNRAIQIFARRMGFKAFGPIPYFLGWFGVLEKGTIFSMTREDYLGRRK